MTARVSGTQGSVRMCGSAVLAVLLVALLPAAAKDRDSARAPVPNVRAEAPIKALAPAPPAAVGLNVTTAIPGQPLVAAGTVPDVALTYTLCLVPNGIWTIGGLTPTPTPTFTPASTPTSIPNTPTSIPSTPTSIPSTPTSIPNTPTSIPNTPTSIPSTPTNTPTDTPTFTPVSTPTDTPPAVMTSTPLPPRPQLPGSAPSTAALIGGAYTGPCVLSQPFSTATNAFSGVLLGAAPGPGAYDLLLLAPDGTILAAQDASAAAGLLVDGAAAIPAGGRSGLLGFALLIAAGAWVLLRQFR